MTEVQPIRAAAWDIVLSILLMILTLFVGGLAAFFELIEVAFTDSCDASCHPGAGIAGLFVIDAILAVVVIAAIVLTVRRLVRRRRGWWIMAIAAVVVIGGSVAAYFVYAAAVGY